MSVWRLIGIIHEPAANAEAPANQRKAQAHVCSGSALAGAANHLKLRRGRMSQWDSGISWEVTAHIRSVEIDRSHHAPAPPSQPSQDAECQRRGTCLRFPVRTPGTLCWHAPAQGPHKVGPEQDEGSTHDNTLQIWKLLFEFAWCFGMQPGVHFGPRCHDPAAISSPHRTPRTPTG